MYSSTMFIALGSVVDGQPRADPADEYARGGQERGLERSAGRYRRVGPAHTEKRAGPALVRPLGEGCDDLGAPPGAHGAFFEDDDPIGRCGEGGQILDWHGR